MCPGLTSKGATMHDEVPEDTPVVRASAGALAQAARSAAQHGAAQQRGWLAATCPQALLARRGRAVDILCAHDVTHTARSFSAVRECEAL